MAEDRLTNAEVVPEETADFFKNINIERVGGKLKCPKCDFSNKFMAKLKIHVECVHLKLRKYTCHLCAKDTVSAKSPNQKAAFLTKAHLETHIDSVHKQIKHYVCEACGLAFSRRHNLTAHTKRNKGACQPGKRMVLAHDDNLKDEIRDEDEVFRCHLCARVYPYRHSLNQHILRVHENSNGFQCQVCPKQFTQKHRLTVHMANAHGDYEAMPNQCAVCGRRFVTPFSLRKHMAEKHNKSFQPEEES